MHTRYLRLILATALLLVAARSGAHGGGHDWEDDDRSYDRARRASERGEILSLADIYARAAARTPGRVLETELETKMDGGPPRWVYELRILDARGRVRELKLDARTGKVLSDGDDD
jgi:uncharacterized membrane protein YkoI